MNHDTHWQVAQRLEGLAGEVRVNLLRLVAVVAFYGHHLVNVYLLRDEAATAGPYHGNVTIIVLAWALAVLVVHYCLMRRWLPPTLKYVTTAWDLLLITSLLVIGGSATSMLPVLYFLVIAAAPLRLSLGLVYFATLGAMAAYAFYLGFLRWGLELPDAQRLPRAQQLVFLIGLAVAGLMAGQLVRQCRRALNGYPMVVIEEAKP